MKKINFVMLILLSLNSFSQITLPKTVNKYPNFTIISNDTIGQFSIKQCRIIASDLNQYKIVDRQLTECTKNSNAYQLKIDLLNKTIVNKNTEIDNLNKVISNDTLLLVNKDKEISMKNEDIDTLKKKLKWQRVFTKVGYGVAIVGVVATALFLAK